MSARNLLISIALFFLLVNVRSTFLTKPVYGYKNAGHGSYGVNSTIFVPDGSEAPKVFFMGNSVYYGTDVIPQINILESLGSTSFQVGNFGFTGAAIYDYIHNYKHLRKFKPDLIVVQFNPTSFGYKGPYYRNDGYKAGFKLGHAGLFSKSFLRATITKDDAAEMLSYSYVPLVRTSVLDRSWCNQKMKSLSRQFSKLRYWTFFPNKLNAVGEWATNRKKSAAITQQDDNLDSEFDPTSGPINKQEYKTAGEALDYFISQLKADNQKALFVLQPSGFDRLPIMEKMGVILEDEPLIHFVDNHNEYTEGLYIDKIHPNLEGAKQAAQRHYPLILKYLK